MAKDDAFKSSFINRKADLEIDKLFRACVKLKASDLHLKVDKPPMVRVDGTLRPMNREPITDEEMVRLCFPLMNERNRKIFEKDGGAGKPEHLADAITIGKADAALAASIFHFGEYTIEETKRVMADRGIPVRWAS